jgi:hypothetical protein
MLVVTAIELKAARVEEAVGAALVDAGYYLGVKDPQERE